MENLRTFNTLVEIMAKLRGPNGCPWDRKQDHKTIAPYCLEEAYEVVDAIEEGAPNKLKEELGDLLLQVVFHAQMAKEAKTFNVEDVLEAINEKLVRRHPHVFRNAEGDQVDSAEEVLERWNDIKKKEGRKNLLDGIPIAMPALLRGTRMGEKAANVGFDWKRKEDVWKKIEEELSELKNAESIQNIEEELGDLLFALTSLARHQKVDAELSLRRATQKFERRFRAMEAMAEKERKELKEYSSEALDEMWNRAKNEVYKAT